MDRVKYNACIASGLRGKKFSKEQRKTEFCIVSKTCSGKAKDRKEAEYLCSLPKEPKPLKVSRKRDGVKSCEKDVSKVAECVVSRLVENDIYRDQALNINSVGAALTNVLIECQCPKE